MRGHIHAHPPHQHPQGHAGERALRDHAEEHEAVGGRLLAGSAARNTEDRQATWRNAKHRWQWRQTLTQYCSPIRDMPVNEIATADVLAVLKPLWSRAPETASRLRGRIQTVLEAAQALGHIDADRANPARWRGHLDHLLPPAKKLSVRGHHAALPYADAAFWTRLAEIDTTASRALMFVILTCARTSEVLHATWDEISFADTVWRVPASRMKMSVAHDVPLSEEALRLLGDQMDGRSKNVFVFPGRPRAPLSTMAMSMLLRRLGIDATVHGFRSSFRDWAADTGVEFSVAEACLAHAAGNAVTRAYLRSSMVERRRPVMAAWAQLVTGADAANVVSISKGRARAPIRRA